MNAVAQDLNAWARPADRRVALPPAQPALQSAMQPAIPYRPAHTSTHRRWILALIVLGHVAIGWTIWQTGMRPLLSHVPLIAEAFALSTQAPLQSAPAPLPPVSLPHAVIVTLPEVQTPSFESPVAAAAAPPETQIVAARAEAPRSQAASQIEIPPSAIQYQVPPVLEYPRVSRRLHEAGHVIVRVFVDEQGQPRDVQVRTSSGYARLDAAAVSAVQRARFRPYTANGVPTAGWALIPLDFILDT